MTRWMRRIVLLLVLLASLPPPGHAEVIVQDGQKYGGKPSGTSIAGMKDADTTGTVLRLDGSGNLMVTEATPAYKDFRDGSATVIDDTTAISMADSSVVINMGKYTLQALAIRMVGNPAATARIAVQIRFHLNSQSDSASIFPVLMRAVAPTGGADTLAYNATTAPSQIVVGRSEFVVNITNDAQQASRFGNAGNVYILLRDIMGTEVYAPYLSVRIRCLTTSTATVPTFKVYLIGSPQR